MEMGTQVHRMAPIIFSVGKGAAKTFEFSFENQGSLCMFRPMIACVSCLSCRKYMAWLPPRRYRSSRQRKFRKSFHTSMSYGQDREIPNGDVSYSFATMIVEMRLPHSRYRSNQSKIKKVMMKSAFVNLSGSPAVLAG